MTAIIGLFGMDARGSTLTRDALGVMHPRGTERVELWHADDAALGAVSDAWEVGPEGGDSARLAADADVTVVADATLYYKTELRQALSSAGIREPSESPAALALAAYHAWGDRFLEHLDGDFAFIVWDRRARRVLAGRDHAGVRPLFYTATGEGHLAIASRLDGLTSLPAVSRELNVTAIADDALFLRVNNPEATAYRELLRLPAGHLLTWLPGTAPQVKRWWDVPLFHRGDGPPFTEAVEELRRLVVAAVAERAVHPGGAAIWLSGGYDSSTLFAASHLATKQGAAPPLHPVSLSYPPDDPGHEDSYIEASTSFWNVAPTWVRIADVPPLEAPIAQARVRDEPFYHVYEPSNRTLTGATRAIGLRAVVVGNGGDQFFSASVARLADHFRAGRFITLAREWREAGGGRDWRLFVRTVVVPNLPAAVLAVANRLRHRRTPRHLLTRELPAWANRSFPDLPFLQELNLAGLGRRPGEGHAALEQSWFLRHVTGERVNASYTATGLSDGVEVRSPLLDARVIRFAAGRPLEESYARRENKRLLRAAFADALPRGVIGPRSARTGLPQRYLLRSAREHAQWAVAESTKGMILADLRVIDGRKFLEIAGRLASLGTANVEEAAAFVASVQVECWLRARA